MTEDTNNIREQVKRFNESSNFVKEVSKEKWLLDRFLDMIDKSSVNYFSNLSGISRPTVTLAYRAKNIAQLDVETVVKILSALYVEQ